MFAGNLFSLIYILTGIFIGGLIFYVFYVPTKFTSVSLILFVCNEKESSIESEKLNSYQEVQVQVS
jgi:hypothetical protein